MKKEKFNITYEQFGKLMAINPDWLFKVMYSNLTVEDLLEVGSYHPTFIFDNAEQASDCFDRALFDNTYDHGCCGFVDENAWGDPWSLTYQFTSFRVNGKGFNVWYKDNKNMEIEYAHPQIPCKEGESLIANILKDSKLDKKLEVDLSEPRYRIKKQICDWLTNETFEDIKD